MTALQSCPNQHELQEFLLGRLPDRESEQLQRHLSECSRCLDSVHSLQAEDSLVAALRAQVAQGPEDHGPEDEAVEKLIVQLSELRSAMAQRTRETLPGASLETSGTTIALSAHYDCDFLSPPQTPDELGRLGAYRVLKLLGAGGMGMVFKAEDQQLKRLVALKVMKPELATSAPARQRFLREAQATAAIEHDHIVAIHQVGEDQKIPFLAMQLLRGRTLEDRLRQVEVECSRLPLAETLRIGREIALGLAAAHEHGLVHRDIKPANIWLESRGAVGGDAASRQSNEASQSLPTTGHITSDHSRVKILDFGLARVADDDAHLTQTGVVAGTPYYMAPEQAEGGAIDHRSDLCSLGCVLYRMTTGRLPFQGHTTLAVLRARAVENPRPPREINPDIPLALSRLITQLLARDPQDRPQSAQAVAELIAAIEQQFSPQTQSGYAWSRHHTATAGVAAMLLALLGTVAYFGPANVYRITTNQGQLTIEADASVEVTIRRNGERVKIVDTKTGKQVTLKAGDYQLELTRGPEGSKLEKNQFTMTRGSEEIVRVRWEPAAAPGIPSPGPTATATAKFKFTPPPPGPLDRLDPANIPADDRFPWQPAELVAVLGEHRGRHWKEAASVAISPDETLIASGGADSLIRLWDAKTMREVGVLTGHRGWISSVDFSSDGRRLLSAGDDRTLRLWDVDARKQLKIFEGHTAQITTGAAFSPDGQQAISCAWDGDNSVRLWNLETGKDVLRLTGHSAGVRSVAISSDGRRALSGGNDRTLRLWDLVKGEQIRRFDGHTDRVASVALSQDGRWALSGGGSNDPTVRLWDVEAGSEVRTLAARGRLYAVLSVSFSPDGKRAVAASGDTIRVFDVASGKELHQFGQVGGGYWSVAISDDGHRIASVGGDGTVRVWDLESGKAIHPLKGHPGMVRSLSFSPDCCHLLTGSEADAIVRLWDLETGRELRQLKGHTATVHCVAFAPNGSEALSGGQDFSVRLWNVDKGDELKRFGGHNRFVNAVALSPDGRRALSGDGTTLLLWDPQNGQLERPFDAAGDVWTVIFSPDGRRALSGGDNILRLWDAQSGKLLRRLEGHTGGIRSVAFSPDGLFAYSGGTDGTVREWDLAAADTKSRTFIKWHSQSVRSVSVSPDGKTLASSGEDGRVVLLDLASGNKLHDWQLPGPVRAVAFAPDGRHLALGNINGTIYLLRLAMPDAPGKK